MTAVGVDGDGCVDLVWREVGRGGGSQCGHQRGQLRTGIDEVARDHQHHVIGGGLLEVAQVLEPRDNGGERPGEWRVLANDQDARGPGPVIGPDHDDDLGDGQRCGEGPVQQRAPRDLGSELVGPETPGPTTCQDDGGHGHRGSCPVRARICLARHRRDDTAECSGRPWVGSGTPALPVRH